MNIDTTKPLAAAAILLAAGLVCSGARAAETPPAPPATLFRHVTVVPMDRERTVPDQSVLVVDGKIAAIGAHLPAPNAVREIDGRGGYLVPGLADMHVHSSNSRDLAVFLANGVTTVLNMGGASAEFVDQVAPAVNSGKRPGPHVYLALRIDGTPEYGQLVVASPAEAVAVVALAKSNRYDFIKVYNNLAPDVFAVLAQEASRQGVPLVGHGVTRVGVERQLAAGQVMVAHLEEYLYTAFFPPDAKVGAAAPPDSAIPAAVAFTKRSGAYVTADLFTYATIAEQFGRPDVVEAYMRRPDWAWLDPEMRIAWRGAGYDKRTGSLSDRAAFLGRFARALSDAGVPLVAGTDAPAIPGIYPGASLRADLYALHAAGLSNFAALSTATRAPGEMMARTRQEACFGVIAVGCRADLLLLRDNPLTDLRAPPARDGVMAAGVWRDRQETDALLDKVANTYRSILSERP